MKKVRRTVDRLTQKYGTADPWILCEKMGVIVLISDLPYGLNGIYQLVKERSIIHINRYISSTQMKLVCAHELAHAILHKNQNICKVLGRDKMEQEAEYFKRYLLGMKIKNNKSLSLDDVSSFTNISKDLLILDFN